MAATLAAGCDVPFEPFEENSVGPFSVFGYLDVMADTQWIRVMPIRRDLLPDSAPIDAVVTLEHVGSGRVVTLRDSIFRYVDPRLGGVGYAHNFWTTEPIEPEAAYRLVAARSDGAATTARVETPRLEASLHFWEVVESPGVWQPRHVFVEGDDLLYVDLMYTVWDSEVGRGVPPVSVRRSPSSAEPGRWGFSIPVEALDMPPFLDMGRREVRLAVATSDWPYEPGLSLTEVAIPGNVPSTVEDGVGLLLGVGTLTIPLPLCLSIEARPQGGEPCTAVFDQASASVAGRVTGDPCGPPRRLVTVRLTEGFPGGGAVVREWKADWDGDYRFAGLEPGSELLLEFGGHPDATRRIPPLAPGQRYSVPPVTLPGTCATAAAGRGRAAGPRAQRSQGTEN